MSVDTGIILRIEAIRTLAFGSIGASYAAIGVATSNASPLVLIQNYTDALLTFSIDGSTDQFKLDANTQLILDVGSNKSFADGLFFAKNTIFYVKRDGTPTSGSVYVSVFYGD